MGIWNKLFGKKADSKQPAAQSWKEKDNRGTRYDEGRAATAYWAAHTALSQRDPFVVFTFDTEKDARAALLELPGIHEAQDTGKLICTDMLVFGYRAVEDGKFEAILGGNDLTQQRWEQAKDAFLKHGGRPSAQGELQPKYSASGAASELIRLSDEIEQALQRSSEEGRKVQERLEEQIRRIGERLYEQGGEPLMRQVAQQVAQRSKWGRYLEGAWHRVGSWLG